ncbi:MAG: transglycosylase SLT domain-containing protein [Gammaproteobacteria bacterium]|nr:transglycosylase SLT domain-containing protein [Gammaproteobacteria bacterium]
MRLTATFGCLLFLLCSISAGANYDELIDLRQKYKQAKHARDSGRIREFERLKSELTDYPLYEYLVYQDGVRRLSLHSPEQALNIKAKLANSVLSDVFFQRWLNAQAKAGRWSTYTEYYVPSSNPIEQCRYAQALHRIGETKKAMSLVRDLWIVGVSQPKECDPIFATWISNGNVTFRVAWQRLQLAVKENSRVLARYLMRFFDKSDRTKAQLLYDVHVRPNLVRDSKRFANDEWGRVALAHGLREFAKDEGKKALDLWNQYRTQYDFGSGDQSELDNELSFWAARDGVLIRPVDPNFSASTIERIADTAMAQHDWELAYEWLSVYPEEDRMNYKWRFWWGIANLSLGKIEALSILEELAGLRTYYGFLAAQQLGLPVQLNGHVWDNPRDKRLEYMADKRIARIFELYAVGDEASAKKEWQWLLPQVDQDAQAWIAHEIANIGWTYDAIQAAFSADALDLIDARFPMLYLDEFKRNAHMTNIRLPILLAIARQESAFNARAISPVGARGLMQLMLPTARRTANNIRAPRPSSSSLLDPTTNIYIGSHHLLELIEEFDNHVLAYAAYNAGSHRVDQWIKDAKGMDTRVWIETIPFHETRNYVKNVISFTQVYGQILNIPVPVLAEHESVVP